MLKTANNEMIVYKKKLGIVDWLMISLVSIINLASITLASYKLFNF